MADKSYLKELIRRALIRNPNVSVRDLAKMLDIDKNTAMKYRNEVVAENKKRMSKEISKLRQKSLEEELINIEDEVKELVVELWKIVSSKESTNSEKTTAIKAIVQARGEIFDLKFDAGLFARKLGEMDLNVSDLVKQVKKELNATGKKTRDNSKEHPEL